MKKICIIYANCQNKLIAQYLGKSQHFNQEYLIKRFPVHQLIEKSSTIPNRLLKQAKLFIYQPVKDIHGDRSAKYILSKLSSDCRCISFPPLYFTGYFPQYCKNPVNKVIKPNYPFGVFPHGDTNIISLLKQGKSVAEITEILSDPNFYSQEFLLANLHETLAELARRESQLSIKVSNFIKTHYQHYYLFYTQNHPSDILGIYVGNQILKLLNMSPVGNELSLHNSSRGVLDFFQIPIYPSVIKHLKLTFSDKKKVYRHGSFCTNQMTFERYISEYIDLHLSDSKSAIFYHFQGIKFAKQNMLNKASIALKKATTIQPNNAAYHGELGNVLLKQNNFTDAELVYKQAIELSSTWEYFYKSWGDVLSKKNDFIGAIIAYQQAIKLNPENADFYCSLGDTLVKQNDFDSAEKAFQQAIVLNPYKVYYYQCLGDIFEKRNNFDMAIANYKKGIEMHCSNAPLYYKLANVLSKQNNFREAITACEKAIKLNTKKPYFHRLLGNIKLQNGDIDNAFKAYQQANKLTPNQMNLTSTIIAEDLFEKLVKLQSRSCYGKIAQLLSSSLKNNSSTLNRQVFGYIPSLFREIEINNPIDGISSSNLLIGEPVVYKISFPSKYTMRGIAFYYVFCYLKENCDKLNVYFQSASITSRPLSQKLYNLSEEKISFEGIISAFKDNLSAVCISDPGHFIPGLSSSFYAGTKEINFAQLLSNTIESICNCARIKLENTLLIGSSAGGMGALLTSTYFSSKVNVFSINTQIFSYDLSMIMLKLLGIDDQKLLLKKFGNRVCCNHRFQQNINGIPNIYILANLNDNLYSRNYTFYQTYQSLFAIQNTNNQSVFDSYCGVEGHGRPDKKSLIAKIKMARAILTMKAASSAKSYSPHQKIADFPHQNAK